MNEYHSDQPNQKKEAEPSDPCTSLVPDGEHSVVPAQEDSPGETAGTKESLFSRKHFRRNLSRSPGRRRRIFRRALRFSGIAALALFVLSGIFVGSLIAAAPDISALTVSPSESATCIYDEDGNILRKLTLSSSNREIVSLDEIPVSLQNAVVAIEDERFFEHGGIDLRGIARAFLNGLAKGRFSEGASTITQQLIKNSVFTDWTRENSFLDRLSRKIQEQYLAVRLEDQMSKEEILENYLNIINFGSGCCGAQAAARRYFGKPASELTLSESAVLAAIPQNPTALNPINFPENNNRRRLVILSYMEEQGYITAEQHEKARTDNVYERIRAYDADYDDDSVYTYYEDALIDQVISFLTEEKGYTYDQAYRAVYSGGLRIVSAQDQRIQDICEQEFTNEQNFPAGTLYGVDYALSISAADGIVTHYGQEQLRSYVRENLDPSFNLMCQDPETARGYADAFREATLASFRKEDPSADNGSSGSSDGGSDGSGSDNTDGSSGDSGSSDGGSGGAGSGNTGGSNSNSSGGPGSSDGNADGSDDGAPSVLAERLTLSPQPQASVVVIDQATGFVRAVVGGRGEKTASLTLNRATETTRQPGSTFKILTAYAPALDACGKTLATEYENQPYEYQDGTPVSNWDLNDYSGPTSIRDAIVRSVNVVAVRCITDITPQLGFQYAQKFGISTLHESYRSGGNYSSDIVQPLALGGITQGVSNLELCGAYAAIANGGIYQQPKFFTRISDRYGNVIADYTKRSDKDGTRVIKASTAWLLTDAMKDVVAREDGTAWGLISAGTMPVAGKTGTTSNYKDIWFAGYTPYYTCCVWGGYDNNDSLPNSSTYHTYNKALWTSIMTRVHAALPAKEFEQPGSVVAIDLCSESNLPAVEKGCTDTRREFFEKGTEPSGKCPLHRPAPETERNEIYQDVLDELFPGTGQTPKADESEISKIPGISDRDAASDGTDGAGSADPDVSSRGDDSERTDGSGSDADSDGTDGAGSADPDASSRGDDSKRMDGSGSADSDVTGSSPPAEQPQTTSLDDMINQLSLYGLP